MSQGDQDGPERRIGLDQTVASQIPSKARLSVGAVVGERYRLERLLGEGGMGQVFEAEHLALGRRFALKVLRLERWSDELVQRFQREARAVARIPSARVAQVTDFGIAPEAGPFFVMELIEGETLEDRIQRDGALPVDQARSIAIETAMALAEVHAAGIVHRDLKPSNIGLPSRGPVGIKLLDFGLAAAVDESFMQRLTKSQQVLGSLPYMAPEQFHGSRPSPTVDLYALGVVLFEMLTGRLPFEAQSAAALIHHILASPVPSLAVVAPDAHVPEPLDLVMRKLLAKNPADRFASAEAVHRALVEGSGAIAPTAAGGRPLLPPTRALPAGGPTVPMPGAPGLGLPPTKAMPATPGREQTPPLGEGWMTHHPEPAAAPPPVSTPSTAPPASGVGSKGWSSRENIPPTSYASAITSPTPRGFPMVLVFLAGGAVAATVVAAVVLIVWLTASGSGTVEGPAAQPPPLPPPAPIVMTAEDAGAHEALPDGVDPEAVADPPADGEGEAGSTDEGDGEPAVADAQTDPGEETSRPERTPTRMGTRPVRPQTQPRDIPRHPTTQYPTTSPTMDNGTWNGGAIPWN